MDKQGLLLCAKYSAAPNFFGYCGPAKNENLVDHIKENIADSEVRIILNEFDSLFYNLTLIATENEIKDPFDRRVVEAYWVGNGLLNKLSNVDYDALLTEKFQMEKRIGPKNFQKIRKKIFQYKIFPHHSFHVFNIFKRTGHVNSDHTLSTMDECRIGWGTVDKKQADETIFARSKPLIMIGDRLVLGTPQIKRLNTEYRSKRFIRELKEGDRISFHWGFVCDLLTEIQVKNLEYYTKQSLDYFNLK